MSIVAMKRKAKLKNLSRENGFSLSGVYRLNNYIGKPRLVSIVKTPFKGVYPVGHGGTNGGYVIDIIDNCKNNCSNMLEPSITKTSSSYISSLDSNKWVKDFNPLNHHQSRYIKDLKVRATCSNLIQKDAGNKWCNPIYNCKNTYHIGGKKFSRSAYNKNIANKAMDASEYTTTKLLSKNCLPTPACKAPFPFKLNNQGCNNFYKTPEEAIEAGLLPSNWMNC